MRGPYRKRRVNLPPNFQNFKPSGIPRRLLETLVLTLDEYEAIRLADYLGMEHSQAAEEMAISRPTFTRLIEKARQKISQVLIEGKELVIEGGNVDIINTLLKCRECGEVYEKKHDEKIKDCPDCGSVDLENMALQYLNEKNRRGRGRRGRR